MIEAKLLVGRYLQFTRPSAVTQNLTNKVPAFVHVQCPALTIQESTRRDVGAGNPLRNIGPLKEVGGQRQSSVLTGTNANKIHRNFKFLPWYEGDISETLLDHDVLTGPMSGCVLTSYRRLGQRVVGHIGTVTVTSNIPANINTNVKAVWTGFANNHAADVIGGFNPASAPAAPPALPGDTGGELWGLYTVAGGFYSVYVQKQGPHPVHGFANGNEYRVAAVHHIPSMTLHQLQNI